MAEVFTKEENDFLNEVVQTAFGICGALAINAAIDQWCDKNKKFTEDQRKKVFKACVPILMGQKDLIQQIAQQCTLDNYATEKVNGLKIDDLNEGEMLEFIENVENRTADALMPMFLGRMLLEMANLFGKNAPKYIPQSVRRLN